MSQAPSLPRDLTTRVRLQYTTVATSRLVEVVRGGGDWWEVVWGGGELCCTATCSVTYIIFQYFFRRQFIVLSGQIRPD